MKDAVPAARVTEEGVLAVRFILGDGGAQGVPPETRWQEVSSISIDDSEYVVALAKLECLLKQRASFEADVLERGAERRQVEDFRIQRIA